MMFLQDVVSIQGILEWEWYFVSFKKLFQMPFKNSLFSLVKTDDNKKFQKCFNCVFINWLDIHYSRIDNWVNLIFIWMSHALPEALYCNLVLANGHWK